MSPPQNVRNFWMLESRWSWTDGQTGRKKLQLDAQAYLGNTVGPAADPRSDGRHRHASAILQAGSGVTAVMGISQ